MNFSVYFNAPKLHKYSPSEPLVPSCPSRYHRDARRPTIHPQVISLCTCRQVRMGTSLTSPGIGSLNNTTIFEVYGQNSSYHDFSREIKSLREHLHHVAHGTRDCEETVGAAGHHHMGWPVHRPSYHHRTAGEPVRIS